MAILNNLIVNGASRFLGKSFFNSVEADDVTLKKITAKDNNGIKIVAALVDIQGELHTKAFTQSNIATIDGSFYITPTISLTGDDNSSYSVSVTATQLTFSGTAYTLDSVYISGESNTVAWTTGSTVIVTGEVKANTGEWMPLGTLKGTLNTYTAGGTSIVINNLKDSLNNAAPATLAALVAAGATSVRYRKIKISLISINRSGLKPLGIFMTAAGSNGRSFIDIYGGNNLESSNYSGLAMPVVRIGNLSNSSLDTVGGITPSGWGIYTSNGFFKGTVAAEQGEIGKGTKIWTIGSDEDNRSFIYSGVNNVTAITTEGIYVGTDGILNVSPSDTTGRPYVQIKGGVITAEGANITGSITASSFTAKNGATVRATVDSNGLKAYDANGYVVAQYGTDVTIGRVATDKYNVFIDADTGIQIRKYQTVLSQFDSTSVKFYDVANNNIIAEFGANGARIGQIVNNKSRVEINTGGIDFYNRTSDTDAVLAHIGYDQGITKEGSTSTSKYPYYTFGKRAQNSTIGNWSVAEGYNITASGFTSHAEGDTTKAISPSAHAEGDTTKAISPSVHAEGYRTIAGSELYQYPYHYGEGAHAEGYKTIASGQASHSEGGYTYAEGNFSHAEGANTQALANMSHTQNIYTVADYMGQTVIGRYNKATVTGSGTTADPYQYTDIGDYAFIIGNGDGDMISDATEYRSNALTVDWDGNVKTAGGITLNNHDSPVGTVLTANPAPDAVNCVSGRYYQVASQTITAGTWIISATASFPATNATGYRDMYCTTSSFSNGTTTAPANWGIITRCVIPAGNYIEFARSTFPVTLSSGTLTFRVVAHHNANTNINVTGRIYATRIK